MTEPTAMQPNDWFKLVCRALGLWWLLEAVGYVISVFNLVVGFARVPEGYSLMSYLVQTVGSLVVGIVLILGASIIADLFYPDRSGKQQTKNDTNVSDTPPI